MIPIFITGTGTDVGKTIVSVIVANALKADYWKPVQAGYDLGTDAESVKQLLSGSAGSVHAETYKLQLAASPHISAKKEGIRINLEEIVNQVPQTKNYLVIEGAGGLFVPLNETEFVADLILKLQAKVILVSRNYLGSINHSLLTAEVCRLRGLPVLGWIFNDEFMDYDEEISGWSGYPIIGRIPWLPEINRESLYQQSEQIKEELKKTVQDVSL